MLPWKQSYHFKVISEIIFNVSAISKALLNKIDRSYCTSNYTCPILKMILILKFIGQEDPQKADSDGATCAIRFFCAIVLCSKQ